MVGETQPKNHMLRNRLLNRVPGPAPRLREEGGNFENHLESQTLMFE